MTASRCSTALSAACSAAPRSASRTPCCANARAINDKVRLLAKLGAALIEASETAAPTSTRRSPRRSAGTSWRAASPKPNAWRARTKRTCRRLAARAWPVLHRLGPLFLGAFQLRAVPAAAATLRAVELLREAYASGGRKWPRNLPTSFLRPAWRDAVLELGGSGPPHLGGGHVAGFARPAARRRHLGRGQPAMARRRRPTDPARPVRRDARGRAAAGRGAGDRGGILGRAPRAAGAAPRRGRRQGRGGQAAKTSASRATS